MSGSDSRKIKTHSQTTAKETDHKWKA